MPDTFNWSKYEEVPAGEFNWNQFEEVPATSTPSKEESGWLSSILGGLGQGVANVGHGIGDLETRLVNSVLGTNLQAPKPDLIRAFGIQPSLTTKASEVAGEMAGGGALAAALPFSLPAALGFSQALTTTGGLKDRGISGASGAVLGGALSGLGKAGPYLMKHASSRSLAKALEKLNDVTGKQSKQLYSKAFEGTEGLKPHISTNTMDLVGKLKGRPGTLDIMDRVKVFNESPTVENIHRLRSEVGKKVRSLNKMKEIGGRDQDTLSMLTKLHPELDANLEKSFSQSAPEKYNQWRQAQQYYAENRVPLNKYKSVRDLLSEERTISPRLKTDILRDENSAAALRKQLGLQPRLLKAARTPNKLLDIKSLGLIEALKHLF